MPSLDKNIATVCGKLGRDTETRYTGTGKPVTSFSLATGGRWTDKATGAEKGSDTVWHNIVFWGEFSARKGERVEVTGRIQTRTWEKDGQKRYITEIVSWDAPVIVEDSRSVSRPLAKDSAPSNSGRTTGRDVPAGGWPEGEVIGPDDCPF